MIESLFELYPDLKLKQKRHQDLHSLLHSLYSTHFSTLTHLRQDVKEREQLRREQVHKNEEVTKRISELEAKIQESERDRARLRADKEALVSQIQDTAHINQTRGQQEKIIEVL